MDNQEDSVRVSVAGFSSFDAGSSTQRQSKSRSKACLHCRRRKMKCDGVKPACFQCVRAERADECEYDDGVTKTNTQLLYERLAQLEKRFRDLQAARADGTAARLRRSPQSGRSSSRPTLGALGRSNSMPNRRRGGAMLPPSRSGELSGYPGTPEISYANLDISRSSSRSSSRSPSEWSFDGAGSVPSLHNQYSSIPQVYIGDHASVYSSSRESLHYNFLSDAHDIPMSLTISNPGYEDMQEKSPLSLDSGLRFARDIPVETIEHLMNVLVPHAHQVGITPLPHHVVNLAQMKPLSDAVGYAMILWGAHFSKESVMRELETMLLQRALDSLPELLSDSTSCYVSTHDPSKDPDIGCCGTRMGHAISASVMLALYFFIHGRYLEGAYHTTTASQLTLACGLHQLPDPRVLPDTTGHTGVAEPLSSGFSSGTDGLLPPLRTRSDGLTRQHKFWNTFVLQRTWDTTGGLTAPGGHWGAAPGAQGQELHPRTTITTPWPEDWGLLLVSDVQDIPQLPVEGSSMPVNDFLAGRDVTPSKSILHIRAKAAALYDAAEHLGTMYDPYSPNLHSDEQFSSLQFTLGAFTNTLMPISQNDLRSPSFTKSSLYCSHSMAHASIIRLNFRLAEIAYSEGALDSMQNTLQAANRVGKHSRTALIEGIMGYERGYGQAPANAQFHFMQGGGVNQNGAHYPADHVGHALAAADKCLQSAHEIVRVIGCIGMNDFEFLEPVVGFCWVTAADVLCRELKRVGDSNASDKEQLSSEIDIIASGLKQLGTLFPIASNQAQKVTSMKNKTLRSTH